MSLGSSAPPSFDPRRLLPALAAPLAVAIAYAATLTRPFTSEDFLLLRFLGEHPPWADPWRELTSSWLGITAVRFWRPVSTLLLALERWTFGTHPTPYNLVHVGVHAVNAGLVYALARRLPARTGMARPWAAAVALLFALYPLHPNAAAWVASFANLFGAFFILAAFVAYLRFRQDRRRSRQRPSGRLPITALVLFTLALGSYEAAVVLPLVVALHEALLGERGEGGRLGRAAWLSVAAFAVLAALYLALRRAIFGVFVGGYEDLGRQLLGPRLEVLAGDLVTSIHRVFVPVFDHPPGRLAPALTLVLAVVAPLVALLATRRRTGPEHLRLWLFGWGWTLAWLAPFAFRPVAPGNGRYWYLPSIGAALVAVAIARWLAALLDALGTAGEARRRPGTVLGGAGILALGAFWTVLLAGYQTVHREAGKTARAVQTALSAAAADAEPGDRLFVTGYPLFLENEAGVPLAQVLRYGLADSVHPPFGTAQVPVYPLPPLEGDELAPVARAEGRNRIYAWDAGGERFREVAVDSPGAPAALVLPIELLPQAGEGPPGELRVTVAQKTGLRYRLVVVTEGNSTTVELGPEAVGDGAGGVVRATPPADFLQTMDRLYGGERFAWIEARDPTGRLVAFSRMRALDVTADRYGQVLALKVKFSS